MASSERLRKNSARWRAANRDKVAASNSAWRAANPDRERERQAAYYAANKERLRAAGRLNAKKRREVSPETERARSAARRKQTPPWADRERISAVYLVAQAYRKVGLDVHVDHIIPLKGKAVSGLHVVENLQLLFAMENMKKGRRV